MDKYKMFRNIMYNELDITKEDVKEWTKEAISEVAEKYIENEFSRRPLEERIRSIIRQYPDSSQVQRHLAEIMSKQLEISIKEKGDA